MYKLAQLKEAEVRGTLAALVDNGIVPVDSQEQFEKVAAETIDLISGYDYDINDVAEASTYALNKVACEEEAQYALGQLTLQKVAGEIDDDAFDYYADAIVKEAMSKQELADWQKWNESYFGAKEQANPSHAAQQVDENGKVVKDKRKGKKMSTNSAGNGTPTARVGFMDRVKGFGRGALDWATGKDIRNELKNGANKSWKNIGKGSAKALGVWAPVAAAGYAGYRKFSK